MKNNKNNGFIRSSFIYILVIVALVTSIQYYFRGNNTQSQQISYSTLVKQLKNGEIKSLTYQPSGSVIEISGKYNKAKTVKNTTGLSF